MHCRSRSACLFASFTPCWGPRAHRWDSRSEEKFAHDSGDIYVYIYIIYIYQSVNQSKSIKTHLYSAINIQIYKYIKINKYVAGESEVHIVAETRPSIHVHSRQFQTVQFLAKRDYVTFG